MNDTLARFEKSIKNSIPQAEELLKSVVDINSHYLNKTGTDLVGGIFARHFEQMGLTKTVFPREEVGDILLFTNSACARDNRKYVLFMAHMDTVFPVDEPVVSFKIKNDYYTGNGCADDKGGAVITWQILNALEQVGVLDSIPVHVLLNTDEEDGSGQSRQLIEEISAEASLVLVMEYGKPRPSGATVVTNRLGRGYLMVELRGNRAAEAMLDIIEKAYLLAVPENRRVIRIKDYSGSGDYCSARISFGFPDEAEGNYMLHTLKKIVFKTASQNQVKADVNVLKFRPPLIFQGPHWEMYDKMEEIARELNFNIYPEQRTSCSDASFVPEWIPVLDGIGPIGDNVHTEVEYMTKKSLSIRPLIIAEMLRRIFT